MYGVFVSRHGGLGGPSSFFCLLIHQRRGDRTVGGGGFCLTPVIIVSYLSCMQFSLFRSQ
jgi:hypothetical protein